MDSQIYNLLARSEKEKSMYILIVFYMFFYMIKVTIEIKIQDADYVKQAFKILDPHVAATSKEKSAKDIENFSQNLYVECAEKAIDVITKYIFHIYS